MPKNPTLDDLLDQWEESRENGRAISPEKLCQNHPTLLAELKQKVAALEAFDRCVKNEPGRSPLERALDDESSRASKRMPQSLTYDSRLIDLVQHERGGLGVVYRGVDEKLNRNVAIKFIQPRHARNENLTQRFMQEAEITGRLDHPGVVPVYAIGRTDSGQPFYSMRFIRGESLDSQIKKFHQTNPKRRRSEQRLRLRQMLGSIVSVCRTIAYSHTRGIVHRDIKPQNIMLGKYGETLVVDWGLALPIGRDPKFRVTDETTLRPTLENELRPDMGEGTPVYMSPEQAAGHATISPASDIYSLGVTLYKVLTGELAFDGLNTIEVRSKIIAGDFAPPSTHRPSLSKPLESICLKAMSLDPTERYETASEMADDLEGWLADNRVQAHVYSQREKVWRWCRRHQGLIAGVVAGALLLSVGAMTASGIFARLTKQKYKLQSNAIQALQTAQATQLDSLNMTCRVAAKSIRLTMEASVAAIEELAGRPDMVRILSDAQSDSTASDLDARRQKLESMLASARCDDEENLQAISWFVLDRSGQLLARSSDSVSTIRVNRPMWMRPYFHGGDSSLPTDLPSANRPPPIGRTNISPMFIGKGKGWQLCSISSPVRDVNQKVVGVIGMTMRAGRFDAAEQLGATHSKRIVSIVETRGQWAGRLLHHPDLRAEDDMLAGDLPNDGATARAHEAVLSQLKSIDYGSPKPTVLDDYSDPTVPATGTSSQSWIAAAAPVRVRSRRDGWLDLGWYLIVQDQPYHVPLN